MNPLPHVTVIKRDKKKEKFNPHKITARLSKLLYGLPTSVDAKLITEKVVQQLANGNLKGERVAALQIHTHELDELAAQHASEMQFSDPDYEALATRISLSNLYKQTEKSFSKVTHVFYQHVIQSPIQTMPRHVPWIGKEMYEWVMKHREELDSYIIRARDEETFNYQGIIMLFKTYLWRINGRIMEQPQQMFMRIAVRQHFPHMENVKRAYDYMSKGFYTHATPTIHNSGLPDGSFSSCFLLTADADSIAGMSSTEAKIASISRASGGIGVSITNIRANNSYIAGCNGTSSGILPWMRTLNVKSRHINQGGKRKGAIAVFLEPWHADIFDFLEAKLPQGEVERRCLDLHLGLMVNDEFMRRVDMDGDWTLMCPNECPGLVDLYGDAFTQKYKEYEAKLKNQTAAAELLKKQGLVGVQLVSGKVLKAREIWKAILSSQLQTGQPYICYKTAVNEKSNHKHLGTIRNLNLCTEIAQFCSPEEVAVCNLASIALPKFLRPISKLSEEDIRSGEFFLVPSTNNTTTVAFDFKLFVEVVKFVVFSLNNVIDRTHYPIEEGKVSNLKHRPMALGVQGLAEIMSRLRISWEEDTARHINYQIFEVLYYAALEQSMELAIKDGPYLTYVGSPVSQGQLQFDMWKDFKHQSFAATSVCNWSALKAKIAQHGLRNSLLVGPMPTVSTSQLLGNTESFEPRESNIYLRRTLQGDYAVYQKDLLLELLRLGMWSPKVRAQLLLNNGSIQQLKYPKMPGASLEKKTAMRRAIDDLKRIYKTAREIPVKRLLDLAADRAPFIDQSQSLNIFIPKEKESLLNLSNIHFYGWTLGLKTGSYYIHTRPTVDPIKFAAMATGNSSTQSDTTKTKDDDDDEEDGLLMVVPVNRRSTHKGRRQLSTEPRAGTTVEGLDEPKDLGVPGPQAPTNKTLEDNKTLEEKTVVMPGSEKTTTEEIPRTWNETLQRFRERLRTEEDGDSQATCTSCSS